VRAHTPKSHSKRWMEGFTPSLLRWIDRECDPLVVILWGNDAQSMSKYFGDRHRKIFSVHPSPLSASRGFFGSKPFTKANKYLKELKREAIDWSL
jgi:uracil-DNA glycosylase